MSRKSNPHYVKRGPNSLKELVQDKKNLESIWNDLSYLQAQCQNLQQSPSNVVGLLRNQELVNRITDKAGLLTLANTLNQDMNDFSQRFRELNGSIDAYRGQKVDLAIFQTLLDAAQCYDQWITSYQLVVIPTAMQITEMFNNLTQQEQV